MLQSGQGVAQLVTKALFDTIDTILCYPGKIDELVVILDAEELECESRKRQVLAKVNEKYMLGELLFHLEILVCNHCFETWLLGRKGLYPKELVPSESFFIHIITILILKIETLKLWVCQWEPMKQLANIISY